MHPLLTQWQDEPRVARPLCELLLPSYYPQGAKSADQLRRSLLSLKKDKARGTHTLQNPTQSTFFFVRNNSCREVRVD